MENFSRYIITLDDDPLVSKIISRSTGLNSLPFTSAENLLKRAHSYDPAAAFIDVHLDHHECGLDILPQLRSIWQNSPLFVITSDLEDSFLEQALALGAHDFIRKPINTSEVVARLHIRSKEMALYKEQDMIKIKNFEFSRHQGSIKIDSKILYLPKIESQLLFILLQNRDQIIQKKELMTRIWGNVKVTTNALDKKISVIRHDLKEINAPFEIKSIYGKGILFETIKKGYSSL